MTRSPAPPVDRAFVVADDLTGANDTGVQFAQAGWSATLQLGRGGPVPTGAGVAIAQSTDTRPLAAAEAARRTGEALATARPTDAVYLKVDSTLRGSVAGQLAGALSTRRQQHPDTFVLLCPAYPRMGRTVEAGVLLVDGRPVTESPAGVDPVTPVLHDRLIDLVPGSVAVPIEPDLDRLVAALTAAGASAEVVALDATSDEDLDLLAEAVLVLGPRVLAAGSAGLAGALARRWRGEATSAPTPRSWDVRRPLVVVSSHHAVARRQVELAAADAAGRIRLVEPTVEALLAGEPGAPLDTLDTVVLLAPSRRADPSLASPLAKALAARAVALLDAGTAGFDALVLIGGDGAEAVLDALGAHSLRIHGRLLEGVPLGQVVGGAADGIPVITKAGGFGGDTTLIDLLTALHTTTGTETSR